MQMEQEVFSRPEVAAAIEANYVPVKINAQYFPKTAREFGVTALPTDIVLTPRGDVVERTTGGVAAKQYVARLSLIATNARQRITSPVAQIAGPPASGTPAMSQPTMVGRQPGQASLPVQDPRFADPRRVENRDVAASVNRAQPAIAGGTVSEPRGYAASPWQDVGQSAQPQRPNNDLAAGANPVRNNPSANPTATGAWQNSAGQQRFAERPLGASPNASGPAAGQQGPSPASPPLAMDGYCPVQLVEKGRWVRGNPKFGVIHRGRTYLFAGPDEAARFYAAPDRFAPVMSGADIVVAVEQGRTIVGRREHGATFDGHIYLFSSESSYQRFEQDPDRYISALQKQTKNVSENRGEVHPRADNSQTAKEPGVAARTAQRQTPPLNRESASPRSGNAGQGGDFWGPPRM
jgi:protein disulfide-isomerase